MINKNQIQITERFKISADKSNYIVEELIERKSREDGSLTKMYTDNGYHGTLQGALKSILRQEAKHAEASAIQDVINHLNTIEQRIIEAINNVGIDLATFNEMYKSEDDAG